jgi:hypothetical protein
MLISIIVTNFHVFQDYYNNFELKKITIIYDSSKNAQFMYIYT